jgi:putative membrane protein insertion efficiency factor
MAQTSSAFDHGEPVTPPGAKDGVFGLAFRVYKALVSPLFHAISPSRCLYLPTCSEYAYTAVRRFGPVRGSWLALCRFARCHPWGKGGLDPVPQGPPSGKPDAARPASGQNSTDQLP